MDKLRVGTTTASSLFQLSDSLWMLDIRENMKKLVEYVERHHPDQILKEIQLGYFQNKVLGKTIRDTSFQYKFKQAAIALIRLKRESGLLRELTTSGQKILNVQQMKFVFFKQTERIWHIPTGNKEKEIVPVNNFVLFSPDLSRTASFETPEADLYYEQFQYGSVTNFQFQGPFSKVRRNRGGKTYQNRDFAKFEDVRFLFRTVKDAKTIHHAKHLEDFSFITTSEADADSFKIASYFIMTGKILEYGLFSIESQIPANMSRVAFHDPSGKMEFKMASDVLESKKSPMGESIQRFFRVSHESEKASLKDSFVVILGRWPVGKVAPEILYMKKIGENYDSVRLEFFYLLAYLNSRKKICHQKLTENFPKADQCDESILIKDGFAYFVQFGWDKNMFSKIIDMSKTEGGFTFVRPEFPMGMFFRINEYAGKLYLSNNPENDFSQIFPFRSSWEYLSDDSYLEAAQEILDQIEEEGFDQYLMTTRPCVLCQKQILLRNDENTCLACRAERQHGLNKS